jgi:hypothetical protein
MKIGLIGNMNNNNFAMMRYFRDLGLDAHLLLFSNDGVGQSQHFSPYSDTWDITHWDNFIHQLQISEDPTSIFDFPISIILSVRTFIRSVANPKLHGSKYVTKKKIFESFKDYDYLLGSGLTPALLHRGGLSLSIFYPYAIGIEWYKDPVFQQKLKSNNIITRSLAQAIAQSQLNGIRKTKKVICSDMSLSGEVLKSIGVDPVFSLCPMVYNEEQLPTTSEIMEVNKAISRLNESDFSVFSHARHLWKRPNNISTSYWSLQDKNNDWLLEGFSKLVNENLVKKPLLILFEYGDDVIHSKQMCKELNIEDYVEWLPTLDRKNIMLMLSKIDVGVGEFYEIPNMIFGGTGYEVLASGKPLIQGFNFEFGGFEKIFSIPSPPLLQVKEFEDVYKHLVYLVNNRNSRENIGLKSKEWFDQHCGIDLAKKWVEILKK